MRLALALALVAGTAAPALAHFTLVTPNAYSQQDGDGAPEKSAPCGQADPGQPIVPVPGETTLAEGTSFDIAIDENIFHPGHYRVAIAQDLLTLPKDPMVTGDANSDCGTAAIQQAALPVLADNLLIHTAAFSGMQTTQVQLPAGFTCAHCMLQVIEFMSDHAMNVPGGCFYHHCAKVSVTGNAVDAPPVAPDVTDPVAPMMGGCCDARRGGSGSALLAAFVLFAISRGRARSAR
jgi:hypothetical protein